MTEGQSVHVTPSRHPPESAARHDTSIRANRQSAKSGRQGGLGGGVAIASPLCRLLQQRRSRQPSSAAANETPIQVRSFPQEETKRWTAETFSGNTAAPVSKPPDERISERTSTQLKKHPDPTSAVCCAVEQSQFRKGTPGGLEVQDVCLGALQGNRAPLRNSDSLCDTRKIEHILGTRSQNEAYEVVLRSDLEDDECSNFRFINAMFCDSR